MKISKIGVYGLFDRFDHEIELSSDDRVTIIIGPNGFGKTMILRILNALFNSSTRSLENLPFQRLEISFDDSSALSVNRLPASKVELRSREQSPLEFRYHKSSETIGHITSEDVQYSREGLNFPVNAIEDFVPILEQIGHSEWINVSTDEILDLDDVFAEFGDHLPGSFGISDSKPDWLIELRQSIPVRFIGTERLTRSSAREASRDQIALLHHRNRAGRTVRTVRQYSDNLGSRVRSTLTEYATLSQSLDRTFPVRLVENPIKTALSTDQVRHKLADVEEKRSRIVEAGLLRQEREHLRVPNIQSVDESTQSVLAVYAQDALDKLSVFDDLYNRVNTFTRIANARFLHKKVSVSADGLTVEASGGSKLNLEMLSSGEQHELVLLYDLLFDTAENSFVMIDEPELSLHVAWQREVVSDLREMANLSDFHVLLATHSPQIIGPYWQDLVVELKGPDWE